MFDNDISTVCREIISRLSPQYSGPIAPVMRAFADELEERRKSDSGDARVALAAKLRDEGATSVQIDGLIVQWGPRPTPPGSRRLPTMPGTWILHNASDTTSWHAIAVEEVGGVLRSRDTGVPVSEMAGMWGSCRKAG